MTMVVIEPWGQVTILMTNVFYLFIYGLFNDNVNCSDYVGY